MDFSFNFGFSSSLPFLYFFCTSSISSYPFLHAFHTAFVLVLVLRLVFGSTINAKYQTPTSATLESLDGYDEDDDDDDNGFG